MQFMQKYRPVSAYKDDSEGSFTILMAVGAMLLVVAVAVAVDLAGLVSAKSSARAQTDNAALAGAVAAMQMGETSDSRQVIEQAAIAASLASFKENGDPENLVEYEQKPVARVNHQDFTVSVTTKAVYNPFFMGIFGKKKIPINVSATATYGSEESDEEIKEYSLFFVLDYSASMRVYTEDRRIPKVSVLRQSVENAFEAISSELGKEAVSTETMRTGHSLFSDKLIKSSGFANGNRQLLTNLQTNPYGETNTAIAMEYALSKVSQERLKYKDRDIIVVFVSDGKNTNERRDNPATLRHCEAIKSKNAKILSLAIVPSNYYDLIEFLETCSSNATLYMTDTTSAMGIWDYFEEVVAGTVIETIKTDGESVVRLKS